MPRWWDDEGLAPGGQAEAKPPPGHKEPPRRRQERPEPGTKAKPGPPTSRPKGRRQDDDDLDAPGDDADDDVAVDPVTVLRRWKVMRNAVIAVAVVLSCLGVASMYVLDEDLPWDKDLRLPDPVAGGAPVAHDMLRQVETSLIPLAGAGGIVLESLPPEIVDSFLRVNSVTLDALVAALAEPEWQPRHIAWREDPLTRNDVWQQVAVMKRLEAMLLQQRGMELEAFGAAFDLMALGLRMQELEALPSYYLHGLTLYQGGALLLADLVNRTRLPTDRLMVLQAGLARMEISDDALRQFFSSCYELERDRLLAKARSGVGGGDADPAADVNGRSGPMDSQADPFFKPNATLRLFASSFRDLAGEVQRAHFARSGRALDRIPARRQGLRRLLNSNWRGEAYFAERIRHYAGFYDQQTLLKAQRELVLTLFALRRYHAVHGRLPAALADLVPEFIPELPIDPFDGEPLRYNPRDAILRSVGSDLVDEGGWFDDDSLAAPHEPTLFIRF